MELSDHVLYICNIFNTLSSVMASADKLSVTSTASFLVVPASLSECAKTKAPGISCQNTSCRSTARIQSWRSYLGGSCHLAEAVSRSANANASSFVQLTVA